MSTDIRSNPNNLQMQDKLVSEVLGVDLQLVSDDAVEVAARSLQEDTLHQMINEVVRESFKAMKKPKVPKKVIVSAFCTIIYKNSVPRVIILRC